MTDLPAFRSLTFTALDLHPPVALSDKMETPERMEVFKRNRIRRSITDDSWPAKVAAFRDLFDLTAFNAHTPVPLRPDRQQLHTALHTEEFEEYLAATTFPERVDAIIDLIYTLIGELLESGFRPEAINSLMAEVHAANLAKAGEDGKPIFADNGKVLKGPRFSPPDIAGLIESIRSRANPST